MISPDLSPSEHVATVVKKAYNLVNLLFHVFTARDHGLLTRAYVTYVRPVLEYASPVWSPWKLQDIDDIEHVQRYFTRRLFGQHRPSYPDRLTALGLESLELRRLKSDLILFFKILSGMSKLSFHDFFTVSQYDRTRNNTVCRIIPEHARIDARFNFFSLRVERVWRCLPANIQAARSINAFRQGLSTFDFTRFLKGRALVTV